MAADDTRTLEAGLGELTDEQWLEGHAALTELGGIPEHELTFVWDADLDAKTLVDPDEVEEAPHG